MRVVCDNCGATYKIPDHKLEKEVNKATCRKCGHRMLIRRPDASHDTARRMQAASAPAVDERTLVRGPSREAEEQPRPASEWAEEAPTQIQVPSTSPEVPRAPRVPPLPQGPPEPAPVLPPEPAVSTPRAARTPAPAPAQSAIHDPAGDLVWVPVGCGLALIGVVVLGTADLTQSGLQRFFGTGLTLFGLLLPMFVVVTGARGRQRASVGISMLLAVVCSGIGATMLHFVHRSLASVVGPETVASTASPKAPVPLPTTTDQDAFNDLLGNESATLLGNESTTEGSTTDNPSAADDATTNDEVPTTGPASAAEVPALASGGRAPTGEASSRAHSTSSNSERSSITQSSGSSNSSPSAGLRSSGSSDASPSTGSRSSGSSDLSPSSRPSTSRTTSTPHSSSSSSSSSSSTSQKTMKRLPLTVVDVMVRSNRGVKKCFYYEKQRSGTLPSRVDVRFTVLNSGRVSTAQVVTSAYKGSELDACLSTALRKIQFPPFEGAALTMTYPFEL